MTSGASDLEEFYERESEAGRLRVEPWHEEKLTPEGRDRSEQAVYLLSLRYQAEMLAEFGDKYYLQRPEPGVVELWVEEELLGKGGIMARIESSDSDDRRAGSRLLYALWTKRIPYATPWDLLDEGLLKADDWETINAALLEENANVAWQDVDDPHGLLRLADELDLAPRCKGTRSTTCYCNCPSGRSHRADLNHVQGLWYCGYCRIGGGPSELMAEINKGRADRAEEPRPDSFVSPRTEEDATLRRIKGDFRRSMVLEAITPDGLGSIPQPWLAHELSEDLKQVLGAQEPGHRGGEDLPDLLENEVEIARLSLVSVHREVTSLRARDVGGGRILLRLVDEYETECVLPRSESMEPLTADEVVALFCDADPSPAETGCEFALSSAFYPDLDAVARRLGLGPREE